MSVPAIAYNIHHDVLFVLGPPISRELADKRDSLDVVSIDMKDWRVDRLGNIRTVGRGPAESRIGSEPDLVVDDQMDRPTRAIVGEFGHAHGFVYDALARKRCIAVQEDAHGGGMRRFVVVEMLERAGLAEHDRVLGFEMTRVRDEGERDAFTGWSGPDVVGAEMVLDVARSRILGVVGADKLV
ncbi:hypothetical protein FS749_012015 [Ceratobasidium sp. UAMH 11750]|nr:hypothetical protein FS749_012015 [Ceratobasidium sp. UAMH 11750]